MILEFELKNGEKTILSRVFRVNEDPNFVNEDDEKVGRLMWQQLGIKAMSIDLSQVESYQVVYFPDSEED